MNFLEKWYINGVVIGIEVFFSEDYETDEVASDPIYQEEGRF